MQLTVAICTWNRCELLTQALEQMTHLTVPSGVRWELLIVNNNCTDATDRVIESFVTKLPVRRLFERVPGLSSARNCAIRYAMGDYIIWTDDDALVAPDWLVEYVRAFRQWPDAAVFGGPIAPWFPNTPPAWLTAVWPRVASAYAALDFGPMAVPLTPKKCPYGINMAMRADYQRRFLYDPERGLKPGSTARGEETDVIQAILEAGGRGWYVPTARVRHHIPPDRQTIHYLRGYYAGQGAGTARLEPDVLSRSFWGRPRWLWKQAVMSELRYQSGRLYRTPQHWVSDLITASASWGQIKGLKEN